jgi:RHS repeat-associated protein
MYDVAGQTFSYDRYGNRQITATLGGVNGYHPSYHASNNRIVGLTYDAVGNLTQDGTKTMSYDANNKLVSATMTGGTASYLYDAKGSRVSKTVNGVTTWQIYGMEGELVAEYPAQGAPATPQTEYGYRDGQLLIVGEGSHLRWRVTDHLGSTRLTVDSTGSLTSVKRQDYLPFGEDLSAGIRQSGGQGQYGYEPPVSNVRQKFTGYERDGETGLDYAQARMYANVQGRFTSVDPMLGSGVTGVPQSWNRYVYVQDNPLRLIDSSGEFPIEIHVRSFAPFDWFGARTWRGDGNDRPFSTCDCFNTRSRLRQETRYETQNKRSSTRFFGSLSMSAYGAMAYSGPDASYDSSSGNNIL